tara:strand:+ start:3110 stop:3622 length:513 start_codon:yes stop_codon:yes gene_type:complete
MSLTTLVTFVKVFSVNKNGKVKVKETLQNGKVEPSKGTKHTENTINFKGENYHYLPFVYQGTTISRSGDNVESNLILGNHKLSMSKAQEAVANGYFVEVNVCIMSNTDINSLSRVLTTDTWLAASLSYDPNVIEILLSSAIDAVGVNIPNLVLTTAAVGKLPVTSDIQNR